MSQVSKQVFQEVQKLSESVTRAVTDIQQIGVDVSELRKVQRQDRNDQDEWNKVDNMQFFAVVLLLLANLVATCIL